MRIPSFLGILLLPGIGIAGGEHNGSGSRPAALATAFVAWTDDPWLVCYNPSGLAITTSWQASLFFAPGQFGLKEFRAFSLAAIAPVSPFGAGVLVRQSGFPLYKETSAMIACARSISHGVALGVALDLTQVSIARYGSAAGLTLDLGASIDLTERLRLGYCWKNITGATIGHSSSDLVQYQSLGVSFEVLDELRVAFELEKDLRFPFVLKGALEQRFLSTLVLRCGCSNNPNKFSFGLGIERHGWELSYAVFTHQQLGLSHQFGLSFRLEG